MARRQIRTHAAKVLGRLDELARISSEPENISRLYLTTEHKVAADLVGSWMRSSGLTTRIDDAGTVIGRVEGSNPAGKTLLIGSHIDSVRNGGRFDGCMGVVLAIEAVGELVRSNRLPPYAIEVLAFGDEEGVRFPHTLCGSRALAGEFDPAALDATDDCGISMRTALIAFGANPENIKSLARDPASLLGYLEVHIEQGPVLESEGLPVGIVTAISGASRYRVLVTGKAGHSGTLPMPLRRDALTAAAEQILAVEKIARDTAGLVATVGQIMVNPGAVNVVAGAVEYTLDVRSPLDGTRRNGLRLIEKELKVIAQRRQVTVKLQATYDQKAATCDGRIIRRLSDSIERVGHAAFGLPSGAGHDGLAMVELCPIGMLFVRCKGGISHHPDESVKADDVETAVQVLLDFLVNLSSSGRSIG